MVRCYFSKAGMEYILHKSYTHRQPLINSNSHTASYSLFSRCNLWFLNLRISIDVIFIFIKYLFQCNYYIFDTTNFKITNVKKFIINMYLNSSLYIQIYIHLIKKSWTLFGCSCLCVKYLILLFSIYSKKSTNLIKVLTAACFWDPKIDSIKRIMHSVCSN